MMGVAYLMHGSDKYRFHVLLVTTSLPLSGKLVSSTPQPHRHTHAHTHTPRSLSGLPPLQASSSSALLSNIR